MNTKVKILTALMSLFIAATTISCSDNNDDNGNSTTINGKWVISDVGSKYASFEFTPDHHYIVVQNVPAATTESAAVASSKSSFFKASSMKIMNAATTSSDSETNLSPIHYGTYTINGNVITLSGFGVLNIILITVEEFTFSFTLTADGETGEYTANLSAPPISESARTKMLCKAWQIDALDIDEDSISDDDRQRYIDYYGPDWKDSLILKENEELGLIGTTVLFSRAGTYLVMYAKEDSEAGLAEWKWANGEETAFYYSWHNWNDDLSNHIAYIPVLTETSCIVQQERWRTIMVIRE